MIISFADLLSMLFYILLIVLVIALIILVINAIKTLDKVDKLVDGVSQKSQKLNGLFSIIDNTTDAVVGFSDKIIVVLSNAIGKLFNRKKECENDEEK